MKLAPSTALLPAVAFALLLSPPATPPGCRRNTTATLSAAEPTRVAPLQTLVRRRCDGIAAEHHNRTALSLGLIHDRKADLRRRRFVAALPSGGAKGPPWPLAARPHAVAAA